MVDKMNDEDELAFLNANFDLNRLTKPQLRGIISIHAPDRVPPVSCKKEELVAAIQKYVLPRANHILSAKKKVRPSAAGITFLDEQSRPSPKARSGLRSSRSSSPSKRTLPEKRPVSPRRSSSPRRSPTKQTRKGSKETPVKKDDRRESGAFESPLAALNRALPSYQDTPKTATHKLSSRLSEISSAIVSNGALIEERFHVDWGFLRQLAKDVVILAGCLLLTISTALFARWKYIHPFPYCTDPQHTPRPLSDVFFAPFQALDIMHGYCLPCPRHGRCPSGRLQCLDGFIRKNNWGLGAHCIPDHKQLEQVDRLGKAIMKVLSEKAGRSICSRLDSTWMTESELKKAVGDNTVPKFDHIYNLAIDDLLREGSELRVRRPTDGETERRFESLKPILTIGCRVRLSIWSFIASHKQNMIAFLVMCVAILAGHLTIRSHLHSKRRTAELVESVFQLLAEQAALHRRDPLTPAAVIVEQLRDALFLKSPGEVRLWTRVCSVVSANSNVREQALLSHGQYALSWEWIGMDILSSNPHVVRPSPPRPFSSDDARNAAVTKRPSGLYPTLNLQ